MLHKRIIGVISVFDGLAVQSFGYQQILPLGRPTYLAENLDRWGADEILVLNFSRSRRQLGPDMALINKLGALGLSTPLSYGGGVTTVEQAKAIIQAGVERICLDSLLHDNPDEIKLMAQQIGAQAIIAAFPVNRDQNMLEWLDHRSRVTKKLEPALLDLFAAGYISEALVIDWQDEGMQEGFNPALIELFSHWANAVPLLLYGGISEMTQMRDFLEHPAVAAVCIGNFLNYKEHAIQRLKEQLISFSIRKPYYDTSIP